MKLKSKNNVDLLNGPILKTILLFSLPILLGNVFQQLYNLVDSIVVGKYVSANALAAVGSTGTISMVLVGVMTGFPTGASVVAAQFYGAGEKNKIKATVSTSLLFLLALSVALSVIGLALSARIMRWVKVPEIIYDDAVTYFRIYIAGMIFMALYNFFAAFLRALGDSTTPLIFLIIASLLNIVGDLFFVIVLKMGVAGVAIATVIAQAISVVLCYAYVSRSSEYFHFGKGELVFDRVLFKDILRLGLPSSFQNSVAGFGMVMVQGLINSYGEISMAAYTAASKMESLSYLPMGGISMSLSLFVGQNIGAANIPRAKKGLSRALLCSIVISFVMASFIYFFGKNIMLLFVNEDDAEVINIGAAFMRNWAPLICLHVLYDNVVAFLRGSGDSIHAMIALFFDLLTRMAAAYIFALALKLGFMGISFAIPCGWGVCAVYCLIRYFGGRWKKKAVVSREET